MNKQFQVTQVLSTCISNYEADPSTGYDIDLNGCVWDGKDITGQASLEALEIAKEYASKMPRYRRRKYLRRVRKGKVGPLRIVTLNDAQATAKNVLRALANLCKSIKPGEAGIWYRSGHGTVILKALEADGTDEAFCAYDCLSGGYVIDDQINATILANLHPEAHLYLIADTCHSGDSTRDVSMTRKRGMKSTPESIELFREGIKTFSFSDKHPKNVTSFMACASDEYAYEQVHEESGKVRGVFTLAMSPHIRSIIRGDADLDAIHLDVSKRVVAYNSKDRVQTPQLERYA